MNLRTRNSPMLGICLNFDGMLFRSPAARGESLAPRSRADRARMRRRAELNFLSGDSHGEEEEVSLELSASSDVDDDSWVLGESDEVSRGEASAVNSAESRVSSREPTGLKSCRRVEKYKLGWSLDCASSQGFSEDEKLQSMAVALESSQGEVGHVELRKISASARSEALWQLYWSCNATVSCACIGLLRFANGSTGKLEDEMCSSSSEWRPNLNASNRSKSAARSVAGTGSGSVCAAWR